MKKILLIVISISLSIMILSSGTYAWFFSADKADNQFSIANFGVMLTEVFDGWNKKEVSASNTGDMPALVRVAAVPVIRVMQKNAEGELEQKLDVNGNPIFLSTHLPSGEQLIEFEYGEITDTWPGAGESPIANHWIDGGDGWYYYTSVLKPGTDTTLFLRKVTFKAGFDFDTYSEYKDAPEDDYYVRLDVNVLMGVAPALQDYRHEEIWDLSGNTALKDMLRKICDNYTP